MTIPTVSLDAGTTAILADATFDLNRLTLGEPMGGAHRRGGPRRSAALRADAASPETIAEPERRIDLNPLLNLLRSRFLQRQLAELGELEAERKRSRRSEAEEAAPPGEAEAERRAAEAATASDGPTSPPSTGTTGTEPSTRAPIANRGGARIPAAGSSCRRRCELVPPSLRRGGASSAPARPATSGSSRNAAPRRRFPNTAAAERHDREDPLDAGAAFRSARTASRSAEERLSPVRAASIRSISAASDRPRAVGHALQLRPIFVLKRDARRMALERDGALADHAV